jgi:hypothetical protein
MSLSGILSILSIKKGKARRKKGQKDNTTSSDEDGPSLPDKDDKREAKGSRSVFGSSAKQESAGPGRSVEVPPSRPDEKTPWGKKAKKDAVTKKGVKKGTEYA